MGKADHSTTRLRVVVLDLLPAVPYYTSHLYQAFGPLPADIRIASATYAHDSQCFKRLGIRSIPWLLRVGHVISSPRLRRAVRLVEMLLNLLLIAIWLPFYHPDVVHIQFTPLLEHLIPVELWFVRWAKAIGCDIVVTAHNILPHQLRKGHQAAYMRLYHLADAIICHDESARTRLLQQFDIVPGRVFVLPHGRLFDSPHILTPEASRISLNLPNDRCIVLWQGIIQPYKGLRFLLKVWHRFVATNSNAILVIVGSGSDVDLQEIRNDIHDLALDFYVRSDFRFVSLDELKAYHTAADILVYPYSSITGSGALLTGITYGKAILASALPTFGEILRNGDNALLLPFGDIEAWTRAISTVVADEILRHRLGARLLDTQNAHPSWQEIARRTFELYHTSCQASPTENEVINVAP